MNVAIIVALPREVAELVKGWPRRQIAKNVMVWTQSGVVVGCAGMGAARVVLACEAAVRAAPVDTLISAGLAGACDPALRVGDVVRAGTVVDAKTGERFGPVGAGGGPVVVTSPAIAGVREKQRIRETYYASAVDMEAATVARIASAHGLEFRAVKAISDEADFAMEGLERFTGADGQFREAAFAIYAAIRPQMWSNVIALARNSGRAIRGLNEALRAEID